jgi:hypothetical protein
MAKAQCNMFPEVNGEPSKLYMGLLKRIKNRPLTNLIYAAYLQQGVAAKMDNQGFRVATQGQHSVDAVMRFFDVNSMKNEAGRAGEIARRIGARDASGDLVDFTDAKDALQRAEQSNNNTSGVVSYVIQHGDVFNILTEALDSRTQIRKLEVQRKQAIWDALEQAFNTVGVDLNSFDFNRALVNANNGSNFLNWLENLKGTRNDLYTQKDIRTLLALGENSTQVQRLKQMFGSMDDVAAKVYDAFHRGQGYTQSQLSLMNSAMDECKKLQGLDLVTLRQEVDNEEDILTQSSPEADIKTTLEELNKKYDIDFNEIHRKGEKIRQLSHAAADAAVTLQRQLKRLKAEQGVTAETKQLEASINRLTKEIANQRYYFGVMGFLNDALNQVQTMEGLYQQASQAAGTNLERSMERARALMEIKRITDGYEHIIEALSRMDDIIVDESVNSTDKQTIENQAKAVKEYFDKYKNKIDELKENTMLDLAVEYLGDSTSNGMAIADIVSMAEADSTIYDHLYSVGRVSNPLIAAMGNVIRDAQNERTRKLTDISLRIRRATNKLKKAGHKTSFMYEPNGNYIISDLDWVSYNEARRNARKKFRRQGMTGLALEEAMDQWQEANTEDRIVDFASGRTERVPSSSYRKAFPQLTQAQQEYYNEMMQIKGELGTLLPKYAQKQYLPPQLRRSFLDAIFQSKGNPKAIARAILNKVKDLYTIREDDPLNVRNGIIDGEEYGIRSGAMDNTPYRQIPIFYINRLKEQGELLKDFSGAIQALAGTAINYDCMNRVKDTVEFMGDFIKGQSIAAKGREGERQAEAVITKGIRIIKDLTGFASNTNTSGLVDGFIDKHIYGVKLKDIGKYTKLAQSLLAYTSLRSLAVNVKGAISNYLVGELQMLIESGASEFYNPVDYAWANAKVFGDNTIGAPGRVMDYLTNNVNSKSVLLSQRFDPINEVFSEQSHQRYFNGPLRIMTSKDFSFIGYGMGEHFIHHVTMYAVLHNTKVKIDGKNSTLYDAFETGNKADGNSELILKNNVEYRDENGNWVPVDDAFLDKIRDRIRYCNQTTHGSMNEEDKGLIHQRMTGRFVMNLRQWMVEHYSRRYRGEHFDASLGEWREGYYNTVGRLFTSWGRAMFHFESEYATRWSEMSNAQKANCRRAIAEQIVLFSLLGLSFALGEPEDHKKEFWTRMWIYQTKRAIMDTRGSTPYGIPMEITKMINSPVAATNTVNALMYPFVGLPDVDDTIKSGRYKGWNKYGRNMLKYWVPFYNQIDQLEHMSEDEAAFAIFNNDMR